MATKNNLTPVTIDELVYSEMIQTEAITTLLVKKGIITKDELLQEVRAVQEDQVSNQKKSG